VTTVLLVDDDPGVRFALTEVLRDRGYRVIPASSGAQALALLAGVDVVVTDYSMPGMDGLELTSQIAARMPGLPVILVTAHGSEQLVRIASSRGACGCLSKPFDIDEIGRVIEHARTSHAASLPGPAGPGGPGGPGGDEPLK
jgi:two-component system response regulator GlrR